MDTKNLIRTMTAQIHNLDQVIYRLQQIRTALVAARDSLERTDSGQLSLDQV